MEWIKEREWFILNGGIKRDKEGNWIYRREGGIGNRLHISRRGNGGGSSTFGDRGQGRFGLPSSGSCG